MNRHSKGFTGTAHSDPVRVQHEPEADLFQCICGDSKNPEQCRRFVERLEAATLNMTR